MEHHQAVLTDLLHGWGLHVPDEIVMATLAFIILAVLAFVGGRKLSVSRPSGRQQVLEVAVGGFTSLLEDTIPHDGRKHLPLLGTLGFFILVSNLFGLVPGMTPPTQSVNITLALAVLSFIYYNQVGIRTVGLRSYLKHLMGPVALIAPLMVPIEIIGHLARNLSLSMRLFGNIFGEHSASGVFYGLFAYLVPLPMMFLGIFASFLQAFIFCLLSMIYIALATEHDH